MRPGCLWFIFSGVGFGVALFTLLFNLFALPPIIDNQVGKTLELKNNTDSWNRFITTPIPLQFNIYMFEVMNPQDVENNGAKPILKEKGPYVFTEHLQKHNVTTNPSKNTITYYQGYTLQFDKKASGNLSDTDYITIVNPLAVGIARVLEEMPQVLSVLTEILDYALPNILNNYPYSMVLRAKVKDILFDGIEMRCNYTDSVAAMLICSSMKKMLPLPIIKETPQGNLVLSLINFRNTTLDGPLVVNDGVKDASKLGQVLSWDDSTTTDAWKSAPCNEVQGNDMSLFSPFITKSTNLRIFSTDMCSSARLVYQDDIVYEGVPGYRMVPGPEFLGDPTKYKGAACFAPGSIKGFTDDPPQLKKGVLDVSSCLNVPVVISLPHFMDADPSYQNKFEGLKPDPKKHTTYMDVQPLTGVPMEGYRRVQINLQSKPLKGVKILRNMPDAMFPLFWLEEGVTLTGELMDLIKGEAVNALKIVDIVKWVLIGFGCLIGVIGLAMGIIRKYKIPAPF